MKRLPIPALSAAGQQLLEQYTTHLREQQDMAASTRRNYGSDVRQFMAWCEMRWQQDERGITDFRPAQVTTPLLTRYRSYLQTELQHKPASVNRSLTSLKRFFSWAVLGGEVAQNPSCVVKLVPEEATAPRQLTDGEEEALVAAVTNAGNLRDRTLVLVLLHTGLRAHEVCQLRTAQITLLKRSGHLMVNGKRNKQRLVPLNATARTALEAYLPTLVPPAVYLFPSERTGQALTERALGHLITKYAQQAHIAHVSPHDLRHRFGYRMAQVVPLHRLAQIMGHDSLDTTLLYIRGTTSDLQNDVEKIAWI